jgi:probable addiction module antidote protein
VKPKLRDYEEGLITKLKKAAFAVEYLNAALEDDEDGTEERFLIALNHVAKAHGMSSIAAKAGIARQAMYRALSESGNPEFSTLKNLLDAMGMKLSVEKKSNAS